MKKINFKKLSAKNFFCYGKEGIVIDFTNLGNVVIIKGKNLDVSVDDEDDKHSSNGVGKSSIIDALVYGLFGKTVKNPKKLNQKDIINYSNGKNLEVEVLWDEYRVIRTRKPDSLRLWKSTEAKWDSSTEITLGGMPATQTEIENILGLTYETFVNIGVFTDDNTSSFLECDAGEKRKIVENLLSLEKYRTYNENAKKIYKEQKDILKVKERDVSFYEQNLKDEKTSLSSLEVSIASWKKIKEEEIKKLNAVKVLLENQINDILKDDSSIAEWNDAQDKKSVLNKKIGDIDALIQKADVKISDLVSNYQDIQTERSNVDTEISVLKGEIKSLEDSKLKISNTLAKLKNLQPGVKCGHCHSVIDTVNYKDIQDAHSKEKEELENKYEAKQNDMNDAKERLAKILGTMAECDTQIKKLRAAVTKLTADRNLAAKELEKLSNLQKPENEIKIVLLRGKIDTANEQIKSKTEELNGTTPYDQLVLQAIEKIGQTANQLKTANFEVEELQRMLPYFEYWIQAFGDTGIRKYIIDEIIPALNDNINYWMEYLIEGTMNILFNNEFEETITKAPDYKSDIKYYALSNGQKGRVNLALSQAFAHVMSLNSGKSLSCVFLDEVTSNIDLQGVNGIVSMIQELAKDKQVFLISHHHDLLEQLNGCDTINLVLKNGTTSLQK